MFQCISLSHDGSEALAPVLQTRILGPGVGAVCYHGPHNHLQIPLLSNIWNNKKISLNMNLNEHYKHTLDWTQKYWSFKTLHYIIPVFHENGVGLVTTTERLIFVNPNKSKSMTESLFQYLQLCPCGGYECDWWCAGARPQLPVLPSEVATSSPLPPPTQLGSRL